MSTKSTLRDVSLYVAACALPTVGDETQSEGGWAALLSTVSPATGEAVERVFSGFEPATTERRLTLLALRNGAIRLNRRVRLTIAASCGGIATPLAKGHAQVWRENEWRKPSWKKSEDRKVTDWRMWDAVLEKLDEHEVHVLPGAFDGEDPAAALVTRHARAAAIRVPLEKIKTPVQIAQEGGPIAPHQASTFHVRAKGSGYNDRGTRRLLSEYGFFSAKDISLDRYPDLLVAAGSPALAKYHNQR